jgi:hypothetical protein
MTAVRVTAAVPVPAGVAVDTPGVALLVGSGVTEPWPDGVPVTPAVTEAAGLEVAAGERVAAGLAVDWGDRVAAGDEVAWGERVDSGVAVAAAPGHPSAGAGMMSFS